MEVFVELNSGLSVFNPFSSISYFFDLLKLRKLGMRCSTWLNKSDVHRNTRNSQLDNDLTIHISSGRYTQVILIDL